MWEWEKNDCWPIWEGDQGFATEEREINFIKLGTYRL